MFLFLLSKILDLCSIKCYEYRIKMWLYFIVCVDHFFRKLQSSFETRTNKSTTIPYLTTSILNLGIGTYNFLDTDNIIESATGLTIPDIFEAEGEEEFRNIEAQVLDSVHAHVRCVVATGGGIVCRLLNWSKLQSGMVVWIDVKPETIMKRIQGTDRPLLQTEDPLNTLTELLDARMSRYEQADVRIEVSEDMEANDVADLVIKELHNFIDENPPAWKKAKAKAQEEGLDWVQ